MAIVFATQTSDGQPIVFKVVRGTRWQDALTLTDQESGTPVDLTGVTDLLMRIRADAQAADVLLELSITNGRLTITDAINGAVAIDVASADTNTFPINDHVKAKYVTDALIQRSADEWEAAISGKVLVLPSISHPLDDTP